MSAHAVGALFPYSDKEETEARSLLEECCKDAPVHKKSEMYDAGEPTRDSTTGKVINPAQLN